MTNTITSTENQKRWRFAYIVALSTWAFLAFETFYEWFKKGEMFAYIDKGKPFLIDFPLYYSAGLIGRLAMHAPTNIYDIHLQDQTLRSVIFPVAPELPWFIQYPPPLFLITTFLPSMSLPVAWLVWCIIGNILLFTGLYLLLIKDCPKKSDFAFIALAVAASFPFWICNRMGQLAMLTIPCAIIFWWAIRTSRNFSAGITTALLLLKFQYLPFLGLVGLIRGRFKYLLTAIIASSLIMIASGMTLGWSNVIDYPKAVVDGEYSKAYSGVSPENQQNIRSLLVRVSGTDSPVINKTCIGLCLAVAFAVAVLWMKGLKHIEENDRFKFLASLTITCMLVFSPHAHTQDYLIMSVPVAWIWLASLRPGGPPSRWARTFSIAIPMLSWLLYIVDKLSPIPLFVLAAPFVVAASWASFCSPRARQTPETKADISGDPAL